VIRHGKYQLHSHIRSILAMTTNNQLQQSCKQVSPSSATNISQLVPAGTLVILTRRSWVTKHAEV
jgi:hypothetical protein